MNSGIQLVGPHSVSALDTIAEQAHLSRDAFVERSIRVGLALGELVLEAGGRPVYVIFEQPDGIGDRYQVEFVEVPHSEPTSDLPADIRALDAQMETAQSTPLGIAPKDLEAVEEMADRLGIEREVFLERSLFFAHQWAVTALRGLEIQIEDQNSATEGYWIPNVTFF